MKLLKQDACCMIACASNARCQETQWWHNNNGRAHRTSIKLEVWAFHYTEYSLFISIQSSFGHCLDCFLCSVFSSIWWPLDRLLGRLSKIRGCFVPSDVVSYRCFDVGWVGNWLYWIRIGDLNWCWGCFSFRVVLWGWMWRIVSGCILGRMYLHLG